MTFQMCPFTHITGINALPLKFSSQKFSSQKFLELPCLCVPPKTEILTPSSSVAELVVACFSPFPGVVRLILNL